MAPRQEPEQVEFPQVETPPAVEAPQVEAPQAETSPSRSFRLRDGLADGEGEPVNRITFGCSPRVSVGVGETFSTADPKLAARLAADPDFEETNA